MKNKLKKISIVSIVFAIIIAFTSSVNAVSTTYVTYPEDGGADILLDGKTYHVTFTECSLVYDPGHQYKNYFCYYRNDTEKYYIVFTDHDVYASESHKYFCIDKPTDGSITFMSYEYKDGTIKYCVASESTFTDVCTDMVFSNFTLKDKQGNVVFQPTPAVVLAPIAQEAPLEGTVQEIVGILPIVLITLVGLIGLRKGLALLSQTLHKA